MAGFKGMLPAESRPTVARAKIWQSMRIMRRFTLPDLCRTSEAKSSNVRKFVRRLAEHGYVTPFGKHVSGRVGSFKGWTLSRDTGPKHPIRCDVCGLPLGSPCRKGGDDE